MTKRCPPGVFCIENCTIITLFFLLIIFFYFFNKRKYNYKDLQSEHNNVKPSQEIIIKHQNNHERIFPYSYNSFSNVPNDIFLNPYAAPLRDDRYIPLPIDPRGLIPINIATQSIETNYRQIGILKRMNGSETILPLMGRPLIINRDKWQFYTMNDNHIKLPITHKKKSCTSEYGCDNIYNGDIVHVDGLDDTFKATIYDNAVFHL